MKHFFLLALFYFGFSAHAFESLIRCGHNADLSQQKERELGIFLEDDAVIGRYDRRINWIRERIEFVFKSINFQCPEVEGESWQVTDNQSTYVANFISNTSFTAIYYELNAKLNVFMRDQGIADENDSLVQSYKEELIETLNQKKLVLQEFMPGPGFHTRYTLTNLVDCVQNGGGILRKTLYQQPTLPGLSGATNKSDPFSLPDYAGRVTERINCKCSLVSTGP